MGTGRSLENWFRCVYLVGKVGKIMGKRSVSLPDWLLAELDEAARLGSRSFSSEVLLRLERDRDANPTGVAVNRLDATIKVGEKEIPVILTPVSSERVDGETRHTVLVTEAEKADGAKIGAWPVEHLSTVGDTSVHASLKRGDVAGIAEKIASKIPGVKKANEVMLPIKPGTHPMDEVTKIAKKRPKETVEEVELIKGFWRETFDCVGDAIIEAEQKGWKKGEYTIKPLDK